MRGGLEYHKIICVISLFKSVSRAGEARPGSAVGGGGMEGEEDERGGEVRGNLGGTEGGWEGGGRE